MLYATRQAIPVAACVVQDVPVRFGSGNCHVSEIAESSCHRRPRRLRPARLQELAARADTQPGPAARVTVDQIALRLRRYGQVANEHSGMIHPRGPVVPQVIAGYRCGDRDVGQVIERRGESCPGGGAGAGY